MILSLFQHFRLIWRLLRHPQAPRWAKAFLIVVPLLYMTLPLPIPFDIPSIIPIIGMLDDLLFFYITSVIFVALCPKPIVQEERARLRLEESGHSNTVEALRHPQERRDLAQSFILIVGILALSGSLVGLLLSLTVLLNLYLARLNHAHMLANTMRVSEKQFPDLAQNLQNLQAKLGNLPLNVFVKYDVQMNAHTFGHKAPYAIVLTSALVEKLSPTEVQAVLAHEMGHVALGHTLLINIMTASRTGLERLVFNRWSRTCEYSADAVAWQACNQDPLPLASALIKLSSGITDRQVDIAAFLQQSQEGDDQASRWAEWFSTHPAIANRVQRLLTLSAEKSSASSDLECNPG